MRPLLISFSGVDGAGKSTQIQNLCARLHELGLRTRVLSFWDDVVVLSRYREGFVHKVYGSERGVGAPDRPVRRRDKNVRAWYLTLARHGLYLLDALHLIWVVARERRSADVLILDRYIYDELANLPVGRIVSRLFVQLIAAISPRPNLAYLLDADPYAAHCRKPEYPLAFMRQCRAAYLDLAGMLGGITIVPPLPLDQAKVVVEEICLDFLARTRPRSPATVSHAA